MRSHDRRGFTLIEMLIAIALGAVIVSTAFAAFRVATGTVAAANKLSVENALVRAGFLASHQELDFWTSSDDPEDTARQPLRQQTTVPAGTASVVQGLPFTPMPAGDFFGAPAALGPPYDETARGWDSDYAWSPSDPRTWWRGNLGEQSSSDNRFGRYALFANHERNAVVTSDASGGGAYGTVSVEHNWLYRQMNGLYWALGYEGWLEYMPANTIYAWYQGFSSGGTTQGGIPLVLIQPGSPFCNRDGQVGYPRGNYLLTFGSSYGVPSVTASGAYADLADTARRLFETNYFNLWEANSIPLFEQRTENRLEPLPIAPSTWPQLQLRVARFIKDSRYVASAKIRWTSPITGATAELCYSGFATSLRGARQQRARAGGWARWDNATGAVNDPTLDSY